MTDTLVCVGSNHVYLIPGGRRPSEPGVVRDPSVVTRCECQRRLAGAGPQKRKGQRMTKDEEVLFTVRALDSRDVYIERGLDGELLKVRVSAPPSSEGETEKRAD
jgi:hypothetical protein